MSAKGIAAIIVVLVLFIAATQSLFTVDETQTVIITQLGKYIRTGKEPGLDLKIIRRI